MNNAEMFKKVFGIYAEEFWAYPKEKMLDWLVYNVPDTNVGDLISRQDAINLLNKWSDGYSYIETETESAIKEFQQLSPVDAVSKERYDQLLENSIIISEALNKYQTADVRENIHGRWIVDEDGNIECSVCGHHGVGDLYCERCGAVMDERKEDG